MEGIVLNSICSVHPLIDKDGIGRERPPAESLRNCSEFTTINHFDNSTLPSSLCVYSYLEFVSFSDNEFVGQMPRELGDCRNLKNLQAERNKIFGIIPP